MKRYLLILGILFLGLSAYGQQCMFGASWTGHDSRGVYKSGMGGCFDKSYGRAGASLREVRDKIMDDAISSGCDTLVMIAGLNSYGMSEYDMVAMYESIGLKAMENGKVLYVCEFPLGLVIHGSKLHVERIDNCIVKGSEIGGYKVVRCRDGIIDDTYIRGFHLTSVGYRILGTFVKHEINRER